MRSSSQLVLLVLSAFTLSCRPVARSTTPVASSDSDPRADFRPTPWESFSPSIEAPSHDAIRDLLCPAIGDASCVTTCLSLPNEDAATCALDLAYGVDTDASRVAQTLFQSTGALAGIQTPTDIGGVNLDRVQLIPVLPVGEYRKHLTWLHEGLLEIDGLVARLAQRTSSALMFRTRPKGFRFFRTPTPSFPSAYAIQGVIGYNVDGPLHGTRESVVLTLVHELFHLNDEGHGNWSRRTLHPVFDAIIAICGDDHECLGPYAPDDALTSGGTYYAFDPRTRAVREYAAELAVRYYREHRAILGSGELDDPPFKCRTPHNATSWRLLADEFFGGLDLTAECATDERQEET